MWVIPAAARVVSALRGDCGDSNIALLRFGVSLVWGLFKVVALSKSRPPTSGVSAAAHHSRCVIEQTPFRVV